MRSPMMAPQGPSRTNVTCTVARYSAILPSSTAAFSLSTSMPVMPRSVLLARSSALRTASSQLWGDAPMICVMRATAMTLLQQEDDLHVDAVLGDLAALHLDALPQHLEPGDVAQRPRGAGQALLDGFPEPVGGRGDDLGPPRDCHEVRVASARQMRKPVRARPPSTAVSTCRSIVPAQGPCRRRAAGLPSAAGT